MRYIKQKTYKDCGIVCLMNAFIWAGKEHITYHGTKEYFKDKLNYQDYEGVYPEDFAYYIHSLNSPFKLTQQFDNLTLTKLKTNLKKDQICILCIHYEHSAHVGLLLKIDSKFATIINWNNKLINLMPLKQFKKTIKEKTTGFIIKKTI